MKRNCESSISSKFQRKCQHKIITNEPPSTYSFEFDSCVYTISYAKIQAENNCECLYYVDEKSYIEKIIETRIVCLGNYSLVQGCHIAKPYWILSNNIKVGKPHGNKCRVANQVPIFQRLTDFQDAIHSHKSPKQAANLLFAQESKKLNSNGSILYLDSDTGYTTKTLIENNVLGKKYPTNFDEFVVNAMLQANTYEDVSPQFGTMLQLITDFSYPLKAVWFDYCGTFNGSEVCKPKKDISKLFESNRLTSTSILGFTFTLRDYKPGAFKEKSQRIKTWTVRCAKKKNYKLTKITCQVYGSMMFLLYSCNKKKN